MQSITAERATETHTASSPVADAYANAVASRNGDAVSLTIHDAIEPVEMLWRQLETVQSCPIHQTYDWCRAWIEATGARVAIIEIRVGGEPVLLLPLEIVRCGGIRVARYVATRFSNINNGIFAEGGQKQLARTTADTLVDSLRKGGIEADCIVFDRVPLEWRGVAHPLACLPHDKNGDTAFQITLDTCFETVLSRTNAKRKRKKYRQTTKRLDQIGGWKHVVADTEAETLDLVETFFRQKGERLRAQGLPDVFKSEETRNFFRALARQVSADGKTRQLQMHAIRLQGGHDGAICAIAGLSRKGDHLICQFASIDDSLCPDTSPGELLFHLMIERSCRDGAALFDLGIGDQRYKRSWCDVETPHFEAVVPLNLRGRVYAGVHHVALAAKHAIKQNPHAYRIVNRLRGLGDGKPADEN